jgi:hypothetical protein
MCWPSPCGTLARSLLACPEDMAALRNARDRDIETIRHVVSWRTLGQAQAGRNPIPQAPVARQISLNLRQQLKTPSAYAAWGLFCGNDAFSFPSHLGPLLGAPHGPNLAKRKERRSRFRVASWSGRCSCVARSEEYRRFAQECLVLARNTEDERAQALLLHMAQVWFRLAEERVNETDEKQSAES